jgi:hypothetical protein
LRVSTSGRFRASLQAGGVPLPERVLAGDKLERVPLPATVPARGPIVMQLRSEAGAPLVFDGWLEPATTTP